MFLINCPKTDWGTHEEGESWLLQSKLSLTAGDYLSFHSIRHLAKSTNFQLANPLLTCMGCLVQFARLPLPPPTSITLFGLCLSQPAWVERHCESIYSVLPNCTTWCVPPELDPWLLHCRSRLRRGNSMPVHLNLTYKGTHRLYPLPPSLSSSLFKTSVSFSNESSKCFVHVHVLGYFGGLESILLVTKISHVSSQRVNAFYMYSRSLISSGLSWGVGNFWARVTK